MAGRSTKKVDKRLIELGIYLSAILFLVSFAGAYLGMITRAGMVQDQVSDTLVDMLSLIEIGGGGTCDLTTLHFIGDELDRMGQLLSIGKYPTYLSKYYILLEYKHYQLVGSYNKECNGNLVPVLFFITKDCTDCDTMAGLLTDLKKEDPEHIYIYTFNNTIKSPIVKYLIRKYEVRHFPTIIIGKQRCHVCDYNHLLQMVEEDGLEVR